jgi:selenocysteine lyase/cysteine desulfurase
VPTFALTIGGYHPRRIAERLAARAINTWDGDMYAMELIRALGLDDAGGVLRVGLMHYTTEEEIGRLVAALAELVRDGD